jgi:hypothetical protein
MLLQRKYVALQISDYERKGCLAGISFAPETSGSSRLVDPRTISGLNYTLIDSAQGSERAPNLVVSEIQFDATHRYAVDGVRVFVSSLRGIWKPCAREGRRRLGVLALPPYS